MTFKPDGYNAVSPYLIVSDAGATIDFLKSVMDANEIRRFMDGSSRIMHAEVRIADTVVMVADSAPDWPAINCHVHVYVEDVDALYRRALDYGAESVQVPVQKGDEDKRGGIRDSGGTIWWIATRVGKTGR